MKSRIGEKQSALVVKSNSGGIAHSAVSGVRMGSIATQSQARQVTNMF